MTRNEEPSGKSRESAPANTVVKVYAGIAVAGVALFFIAFPWFLILAIGGSIYLFLRFRGESKEKAGVKVSDSS